jgi:hypothetical protein
MLSGGLVIMMARVEHHALPGGTEYDSGSRPT